MGSTSSSVRGTFGTNRECAVQHFRNILEHCVHNCIARRSVDGSIGNDWSCDEDGGRESLFMGIVLNVWC